MLDEELWIYVDFSFKAHDPYSLIFLSTLGAAKNPTFFKAKTLLDNVITM
jgi:hypothetical protein